MNFRYMLAPLEDTTGNALRELCWKHGADLTFTEMTRLQGLIRDNKSTLQKITLQSPAPTQIQLSAQKEESLKLFLSKYNPEKGFAGINLNLACPSPHLIREGMGCALIKRVSKVSRLLKIIQDHSYSATIKMRLGMNSFEKKNKAYFNLINGTDADFYVVHARHGAEHYEAPADYSVFPACAATGRTIIANGDIDSKEKVQQLKKLGVKGVMIGRAAISDPAIFERLKGDAEPTFEQLKEEYLVLSKKYPEASDKYDKNLLKRIGQKKSPVDESGVQG